MDYVSNVKTKLLIKKGEKMNYHIEVKNTKSKWERIASFQNICDRDDCKDFLADRYPDYAFRNKDEE